MNFFGLWSSTPEETGTKEDDKKNEQETEDQDHEEHTREEPACISTLSKMGDDKIFSTYDSERGQEKASHYSPPNLLLNMSQAPKSALNTGFKIDPEKYKSHKAKQDDGIDFNEEVQSLHDLERKDSLTNRQTATYGKESISELSDNLFGISHDKNAIGNQANFQSCIIPDYVHADAEYDDLSRDFERLPKNKDAMHASTAKPPKTKSTYINEPPSPEEKGKKFNSQDLFAGLSLASKQKEEEDTDAKTNMGKKDEVMQDVESKPKLDQNPQSLSISRMLNNKVTNALNYFNNRKSDEVKADTGGVCDRPPKVAEHNKSTENPDTKLPDIPEQRKSGKDELLEEDKVQEENDSEDDYLDDITEDVVMEKQILHQREIERLLVIQLQKRATIKQKHVDAGQISSEIKLKEQELSDASANEDYDLAEKVQDKIDSLQADLEAVQKTIAALEKQNTNLEMEIKQKQSDFLGEVKDTVYKLIELETKNSTEKSIFQKTQEEKIIDQKEDIKTKQVRIDETEKELQKKIDQNKNKLKVTEEKCYENAKEHVDAKSKIDEDIKAIDAEIAELEKILNQKIDQKEVLEEQRVEKSNLIKKINKEFQPEIDEMRDIVGKYERKLLVNQENRVSLEHEVDILKEQEQELAQKLVDFDSKIEEYTSLAHKMRTMLRNEEKEHESLETLVAEYQLKLEKHDHVANEINQHRKSTKENEKAITEYETELANHYRKIDEHDKVLENLEDEKKTLAQNKKFKEAKRVKDLITLKTEKKDKLSKRIEEVKHLKQGIESAQAKTQETFNKYEAMNKDLVEELKYLEYQILLKKQAQIIKFSTEETSKNQEEILAQLEKEIKELEDQYDFKPEDAGIEHTEDLVEVEEKKAEIVESQEQAKNSNHEQSESSHNEKSIDEEDEENTDEEFIGKSSQELKSMMDELEKKIQDIEKEIEQAAEEEDFDKAEQLSGEQDRIKAKVETLRKVIAITDDDVEEEEVNEDYCQVPLDQSQANNQFDNESSSESPPLSPTKSDGSDSPKSDKNSPLPADPSEESKSPNNTPTSKSPPEASNLVKSSQTPLQTLSKSTTMVAPSHINSSMISEPVKAPMSPKTSSNSKTEFVASSSIQNSQDTQNIGGDEEKEQDDGHGHINANADEGDEGDEGEGKYECEGVEQKNEEAEGNGGNGENEGDVKDDA